MTDTVLVVGAGPVGLTAACQLARLGVPVRVVEALERPTTESRAVAVHARSMEMLAALGVLPRLEARGRRVPAVAVLDGRTGATRLRIDATGVPSRHQRVRGEQVDGDCPLALHLRLQLREKRRRCGGRPR